MSLILSVFGSGMSIMANQQANQQNMQNANTMLDKEQQLARQNAAEANAQTVNLYNQIYSPKAKMQQLKDAGLSPGLFYSGGGAAGTAGAAAQATTPNVNVPTLNPIVDNSMINRVVEAVKTASETKKTQQETKNLEQEVEETKKNIQLLEKEIDNKEISTANAKIEGKLLEYQVKFQQGTIEEQINSVKESLMLLESQREQAWELLQQMKVDTKYKEQFKKKEYEYLDQQTQLVVKNQLLTMAQTLKEEAQTKLLNTQSGLNEKQAQELQYKIDAIEKYGYMVVNGNGWQDRIINALIQISEEIANFLGGKDKDKNKKMGGAGGKF